MTPDEAKRALEVLRQVVEQAKDDTALQNWGAIWLVHAFTNSAAFIGTNLLIWHGYESRWVYAALWSTLLVVNIGTIFVMKQRRTGVKTFIENQIWAIWLTFIGCVVVTAVVNDLMQQPVFRLAPVIAILSAFGFAQMGSVIGKRWFLGCAIFGLAALAMALFPNVQFIILGVVWGIAQLVGGIWLQLDKRKQRQEPRAHVV